MTPSYGTSLVRSCSNSASSISSHGIPSGSPTASNNEGHEDSGSTSKEGNRTDDKSVACSNDEAPKEDKHQDDEGSDVIIPNSDDEESREAGSDVEGSTSHGSHCTSDSEDEALVHTTM